MKSLVKEVAIIMGMALVLTTLSAFFHPKRPAWYLVQDEDEVRWSIDEDRAKELMAEKDVLWVDARKKEIFEKEHFPGAISLDLAHWGDQLFQHQAELQGAFGKPVIVYCDGSRCEKSKEVAKRLRELMGLEPVYLFKGKWRKLVH